MVPIIKISKLNDPKARASTEIFTLSLHFMGKGSIDQFFKELTIAYPNTGLKIGAL